MIMFCPVRLFNPLEQGLHPADPGQDLFHNATRFCHLDSCIHRNLSSCEDDRILTTCSRLLNMSLLKECGAEPSGGKKADRSMTDLETWKRLLKVQESFAENTDPTD